MAKERQMVDFGYQESELDVQSRGTVVVLDSFDEYEGKDLQHIVDVAEGKHFIKVVLFPHNEKTLRSMGHREGAPFHKRVKHLETLVEELPATPIGIRIDRWEEKRKKYTPMEMILRYVEETYKAPYFLYLTAEYANLFSTFASFEECLKKVRLLITKQEGVQPTSKLEKFEKRWEYV
jgi:nicotinic acid mononucleotide adenylyltransferase